jgi:putative tricarboxylic transport membrane protein
VSKTARLAVSAALVACALAAVGFARGIPSRHVRGDPGPGALPIASAIIVLAGAAVGFLLELRQPSVQALRDPVGSAALPVALATVLYLVLMTVVGYLAATVVCLAGISWYLDRQRRHAALAHGLVAATVALVSWFVFGRLLGVALPVGPWGF